MMWLLGIWITSQGGLYIKLYLDMCSQLILGNFEIIIEGKLKQIAEDGRGHVIHVDEALRGLSHAGLGQSSEVLTALWKSL